MNWLIKLIRWMGLPAGGLLLRLGLRLRPPWLRFVVITFGGLIALIGAVVDYWSFRPNRAWLNPRIPMQTWTVVENGWHNSNTDLIYWRGSFYLVYACAPSHLASVNSHLVLLRSPDARNWEQVARLAVAPEDIRDPKFAPIRDRLFLYALKNVALNPEPYTTVYASSRDGLEWSPFQTILPEGWLFWRPKSRDGETWYVPAYWWEHGRSALFVSRDGIHWSLLSTIHTGGRNDETDIEFLPDGRLIAAGRLEYGESICGHPHGATLIAVSNADYTRWEACVESRVTRLDGPNLFSWRGRIYALGRYQPEVRPPFQWQGSAFARKRTALFAVDETGLYYLSDLPSSGDTAYAGAVVREDVLYACYYTSNIRRDPVWIVGILDPSSIRMARISMPAVEAALSGLLSGNQSPCRES